VLGLQKDADVRLAARDDVRFLCSLPWFSALVIARNDRVVFERYASDFGPDQPHSIQSISKTLVNLIAGCLVGQGVLDLEARVADYIPRIGTGYAQATLQQVLNMDVRNEYSEDFTNPHAMYYEHEEAMGWRLPKEPHRELTQHAFLSGIESTDVRNTAGVAQYKCANTDIMGWIAEEASGRPLRSFIADIVDAAGLEHALSITCDRDGVPSVDGGACMTARDLIRYLNIFLRRGQGVNGRMVGDSRFIEDTMQAGVPMAEPYGWIRYSNNLMVSGRTIAHGGWGGQYVVANMDTGIVAVLFSVVEDKDAVGIGYSAVAGQTLERLVNSLG